MCVRKAAVTNADLEHHEAAVVAINAVLAERRAIPMLDEDEARAVRRLARERDLIIAWRRGP